MARGGGTTTTGSGQLSLTKNQINRGTSASAKPQLERGNTNARSRKASSRAEREGETVGGTPQYHGSLLLAPSGLNLQSGASGHRRRQYTGTNSIGKTCGLCAGWKVSKASKYVRRAHRAAERCERREAASGILAFSG